MVPSSSELPLRDWSPLTDLSRAFLCPNWCWTLFTRGLSTKRSAQQPLCCWLSASRFSLDVTFLLCWECFSLHKDLYTLPSALWCGYSIFPLRSCLHQVISSIEQKRKYLYFYNAKNAHKDLRAKSPVFMRFFIIQAWFVLSEIGFYNQFTLIEILNFTFHLLCIGLCQVALCFFLGKHHIAYWFCVALGIHE